MKDLNMMEDNVTTIDLTLSSPEPESQPQITPQKSQLTDYFKKESRSYNTPYVNHEQDQRGSSFQSVRKDHQTRHASPGNINQIINTSDPMVLKKVLLELCQMSPALRGAVTRGLASHSRKQHGIKREREVMQTPASQKLNVHKSYRPYESVKQTPAVIVNMDPDRSSNLRGSHTQHQSIRRPTQTPAPSQFVSHVKREYPLALPGSGSDEDELHVPGSFPRSAQRVNSASSAQDAQQSSSASNRGTKALSLSERLAIIKQEKSAAPKRCAQCGELFLSEEDMCIYHPGYRISQANGEDVWSCCKFPVEAIGCDNGKHIDPENRFKRSSVSPSPDWMQQKQPKLV